MPTLRRLIPLVIALAWASAATPVAADCDFAGPVEEVLPTAQVAFVGRAVDVRGPIAQFAVIEVWAGNAAEFVEVRGLLDPVEPDDPMDRPAGRAQLAEDDREWVEGAVYLVIPFVDGGVLRDHICTATTEWTDELAALRPASVQVVEVSSPIGPILIGLAVVAIGALSILGFRHPRR